MWICISGGVSVFSPVKVSVVMGVISSCGLMRMGTGVRALSQSFILTDAYRTNRESSEPIFRMAFIDNAVAVLRLDFDDSVSYQMLFNPPLACKEKETSEQK